jgi:hypothetical protein
MPTEETKKKISDSLKKTYQEHPEMRKRISQDNTKYTIGEEKIIHGYIYIYLGHDEWIGKHRKIMENIIGRKLLTEEHVHHIDENPLNNSPENLKIVSNSEHQSIHHKGEIHTQEQSNKQGETRKRLYKEGKLKRDCSQMHTPEVHKKISETMKDRYTNGVKMGWSLMHDRGYKHSDACKQKQSETRKRKYASGETFPYIRTPEIRQKIREALKKKFASGELRPTFRKHTEEEKQKQRETMKRKIASGEIKVDVSAMHSKESQEKALISRMSK